MPGSIGPLVALAITVLAPILAQGQSGRRPPTIDIVFWLGVLVFACIIGYMIVTAARKQLDAEESGPSGSVMESFGLSDLKRMHREGQLTDDEYERARRQVLIAAGAIDPDAGPDGEDSPSGDSPVAESENSEHVTGEADELGPELLPDTEAADSDEGESRKRDSTPESEDDSKPRFD